MKFARIEMLFLIWSLPVLFLIVIYGARRRKRIINHYASGKGQITMTADVDQSRRWVKWGLILFGLLFVILALTGPQYGYRWQEMEQKGVDIIIALDCSKSMLANDIQPTRLDRAKREVVDLLHMLKGDRVGLVAFAGTAFLQCPLTVDYQAFYLFLDTLTPEFLPVGGTDLPGAIEAAISGFNKEDSTQKAIILITDGENTGQDPKAAVDQAKAVGIKVFPIGVGNDTGVPVPSETGGLIKDTKGNIVVTRLDENLLKEIAAATDGLYVRSVAGDMDLEAIYEKEIRGKMEASTLTSGKKQIWQDRFQWCLIVAIVLFIADAFLPNTVKSHSQGKIAATMAVFLMLLYPRPGFAETTYGMVEKGITAYDKGDYETALKHFIDAQVKSPDKSEIYYNIGNTYYKLNDYDAAIKNYAQALNTLDDSLKQKARYNLGNANFRKQAFEDAISEYENALKLNPKDQEAKENLEYAKKMLEQQQQSQESSEKSSDDPKQSQDNDKKDSGEKPDKNQDNPSNQNPEENKQEQQQAEEGKQDQQKEGKSTSDENKADENSSRGQFGSEMNDSNKEQGAQESPTKDDGINQNQEPAPRQKPSPDEVEMQQADRRLNRLKDAPGKALIPAYRSREVEKDW